MLSKCEIIEDEIHFVSKCAVFDSTRKKFIQEIIEFDQTLSPLNGEELSVKLMTGNNCFILRKLLPFIMACFAVKGILRVGIAWQQL